MDESSDLMVRVIEHLQDRFGRLPTEKEVLEFIEGDLKQRTRIWNQIHRQSV